MPELAPESVSEVTMTRKAQFERDCADVVRAICETLERCAQTKLREVSMDGHARLLLTYAREVKRRHVYRASNVVERDPFTHARGEVRLDSLGSLCVIHARGFTFRLLLAALDER